MLTKILLISQLCFTAIIGMYFFSMLKGQYAGKNSIHKESTRELERLKKLNGIKLSQPLTELTRPQSVSEIVGQEEGIRALRAALCGANPQHVLIYGPPGVGKTAAARVVLEEAKKSERTPFLKDAKFVEVDATIMQFDERSIADPLIGSVHDPIYQGAGAYGPAGVPQPKEGAVSRAHGGVLFIDEIGELHQIQMNKLLKVLEDRRVFFDSAYYSSGNKEIPRHIHEMFQRGIPADFRLIGATTRSPEEIPPALRSRCVEVFFSPLSRQDVRKVAVGAAKKGKIEVESGVFDIIEKYADNGRDAVGIVQTARSAAELEKRTVVDESDARWAVETGRYQPRYERQMSGGGRIGEVYGLAVSGSGQGFILDIEAVAQRCERGRGTLTVTGAIGEEELKGSARKLKRESSIHASVKNVMTILKSRFGIPADNYNIHINFPGSIPVDGPSAGIAILCAVWSAIKGEPVKEYTALTGEAAISGTVCGVGEVSCKIRAACCAGAKRVIIPSANYSDVLQKNFDCEIIPVSNVFDVICAALGEKTAGFDEKNSIISDNIGIISAEGVDISK